MAGKKMDNFAVDEALAALGCHFQWHCDVEILLVGGAAGMVTGVLPPERTTVDCDVILYSPEQAWIAVEAAADEVAEGTSTHEGSIVPS
jgi:hypothetical protein